MVPSVGRIVHYKLTPNDVRRIENDREHYDLAANSVNPGDVYPMLIVRVWAPGNPASAVQGQVFLDGEDSLWVTSVSQAQPTVGVDAEPEGSWFEPPRV